MAAQMEYVIALTSTLQDLTQLFMELDRYKVKYDDYMAKVSIEERPPTPANVKKKKEKERKQKVKLTQKMREEEKAAKKNLFEKQKMVINEEKLSKEKTDGKAEKKTEEKTEEKAEEVEEEELWEEEFETKKTPTVFESRKEAGFVVIEDFKVNIHIHVFQLVKFRILIGIFLSIDFKTVPQVVWHKIHSEVYIIHVLCYSQMMVDEATFGRMVMIYWRKLMQVLSAKIFMVTPSLRSYIELRLSPCLEDDPQSANFYLAYKTQVDRLILSFIFCFYGNSFSLWYIILKMIVKLSVCMCDRCKCCI